MSEFFSSVSFVLRKFVYHFYFVLIYRVMNKLLVMYILLDTTNRYCVCVKRKMLCNVQYSSCYCFSASRVWNIGVASHIFDFGPYYNVKSHVCCHFLTPSENGLGHIFDFGPYYNLKSHVCCHFLTQLENGLGHFNGQLKHQTRVVLRKKLLMILLRAVQKLKKLSILSLLITNNSSIYSIFLFYLSFYLAILLVIRVSLLQKSTSFC